MRRSIRRFYGPEFNIKPEREEGRSLASMPVEPKPEPHPLQVRLEQALGNMIREAEPVWNGLPKADRDQRVRQYDLLLDCLRHVTITNDPAIPCPWTREEVFDSMADYIYNGEYHKSTSGMLSVHTAKLVRASVIAKHPHRRKVA